jgi:hypothetical protein
MRSTLGDLTNCSTSTSNTFQCLKVGDGSGKGRGGSRIRPVAEQQMNDLGRISCNFLLNAASSRVWEGKILS